MPSDSNDLDRFRHVVGIVLATSGNGRALDLGNAFIIYAADAQAVCLSATHCFEEAKRHMRQRSGRAHMNVAPGFEYRGPEYLATETLRVLFVVAGELVVCNIDQYNAIAGYDVAVFTAVAPEGTAPFKTHLAIDLSEPQIGEQVAVLANHITNEVQDGTDGFPYRGIIGFGLQLRAGTVSGAAREKLRLGGQMASFVTSIQIAPGMSGAPLVANREGTPVVRGVVSSDCFESEDTPGKSVASLLWPAMGLGLKVDGTAANGFRFIGDLVAARAIDNRSHGVSIHVRQHAGTTEVLYVDPRQTPPLKNLLRMTPHPDATGQ